MGTINTTKLILNQAVTMAKEKSEGEKNVKDDNNFVMAKKIVLTTDNISMVKKSQAEKKVIRNARKNITKSKKSIKNNTKSRIKKDN